jgi:hypothetical protein
MSATKDVPAAIAADRPRLRHFLPALALLVVSVSGFGLLSVLPQKNERQLAVLFPPRISIEMAASLVASAGGELVDSSRFPNLVIATSDTPGFAHALYKVGAWLVMDPIIARGCGSALLHWKGSY